VNQAALLVTTTSLTNVLAVVSRYRRSSRPLCAS
jgi:hypothetical protein